jgi:cell division protease FtsH
MVCEWGMSETLGPLAYGKDEEHIFLGKEIGHHRDFSENTSQQIDDELRRIISNCYERAKGMVFNNIEALHRIANRLLEKEALDGQEIDALIEENKNGEGVTV